ncbi:hypothetical protein PVK06_030376 [Gossypium arboreum]|uniref:Uncharacterized protein n=1 Tax=Gossypium arboreum TaxID=29729 RepID=A0ABR0NN41_GOSAR|nr:hypothetical protein PVK06_030376 [Gossypium arboreum]
MLFLLTVLTMDVLDLNLQPVEDLAPNANPKEIANVAEFKKKREKENFTCRGHILNTFSDRFIPIMDQVHELQVVISRFRDLKVVILELLQVRAIILKLPLSWNNYRKKLLHMAEDFTVEKILMHLRIEEETQKRDVVYLPQISKVNHTSQKEADATTSKANMVEDMDLVSMIAEGIDSLEIGMIIELNIAMNDKSCNWWLDSRATVHVCNDQQQFKIYELMANHEVLIGNYQSVKMLG